MIPQYFTMEARGRKSNLILKYCRQIFQATEKKKLDEIKLDDFRVPLQHLEPFFGIEDTQTILVLVFMIESALREQTISIESLLTHFGNNLEDLSDLEQSVDLLLELKYCRRTRSRRRRSRLNNNEGKKSFLLSELVIEAVTKGDKELLKPEPVKGIIQFAQEVAYLTNLRWEEDITTDHLLSEVTDLMEHNSSLSMVEKLQQYFLPPIELALLWNVCHRHIHYQREHIDIADILSEIEEDSSNTYLIKKKLKEQQLAIQQHGFIEYVKQQYGMHNLVKPTQKLLEMLYEGEPQLKVVFAPKHCRLDPYDTIPSEQLFYNEQEQVQLDEVEAVLSIDKLGELQARLDKLGYTKGVNILLYGYPGTGKTASVKQWARKNQRHLLWVEVNKIKSPWVGESEQNLQAVFEEYEKACKVFPQMPILLFNEADAILGKRMDAQTSVDRMENAMQNILLQRLEDFNGIFIATTNMANQLDKAFDRRFLYKIHFNKPSVTTRMKILESVFPFLNHEELLVVNEKYALTGGQMMNVKKRFVFQELLSGKEPNFTQVMACIEEEIQLSGSKREAIGFVR